MLRCAIPKQFWTVASDELIVIPKADRPYHHLPETTGTVVPRFGRFGLGLEEKAPTRGFRKVVIRNRWVALVEDASCLAQ